MKRVHAKSGLSDSATYLPAAIHPKLVKDGPQNDMDSAKKEAEMVCGCPGRRGPGEGVSWAQEAGWSCRLRTCCCWYQDARYSIRFLEGNTAFKDRMETSTFLCAPCSRGGGWLGCN